MKEYDISFAAAVSALGNSRSCRIRRFDDEASAVLLLSLESSCPPLLLGCPQRALADFSPHVTEAEREALGLSPEENGESVEVFCRMSIPDGDPLSAGFDCSRLVLAAPSTGRALEVFRPGEVLVPLRPAVSASVSGPDRQQD